MSGEHYLTEDMILPLLELPSPCEIRIDISDDDVTLHIGPRDLQWKRGCPDTCGAGTMFEQGVPFDPSQLLTHIDDDELKGIVRGMDDFQRGRVKPFNQIKKELDEGESTNGK